MKMRGLIIAAVLLAALIGTLYWSNHRNSSSSVQASADTPPKVLSLNDGDIREIDKPGRLDTTGVSRDNLLAVLTAFCQRGNSIQARGGKACFDVCLRWRPA